ncbi:conjugal transfer protein [Nocardia iowensis]|nr:conjugal transfer protein [Nocardia iowensis]
MRIVAGRSADSGEALLRRMAARRRRDNVIVAALAVLAVLGGGNAIVGAFSGDPPVDTDQPMAQMIGRAELAGAYAADFVVTYLSASAGQQDRIIEYVAAGQQITLPASGRQVSDPSVVHVWRAMSNGGFEIWSVTVSVRVGKNGAQAADTKQFYRVAVSVAGGRLRALSLPAVVEPPGRGSDLALAYSAPCATESPLAEVASGFLTALLTGSGDISRYTTVNAGIAALRPAPFGALSAVSVSADDTGCGAATSEARVLATVTPKIEGATASPLAYPLTMVRTAGHWQVQTMEPVPALADPITVLAEHGQPSRAVAPSTSVSRSSSAQIPPPTQK